MRIRIAIAAAAVLLAALVHPAPAQDLAGDLNADGFVGELDRNVVLGLWDRAVAPGFRADPSGDCLVDQDDLDIVQADWGQGNSVALSPSPGISLEIREIYNHVVLDTGELFTGYVTQELVIETNTDWLGAQLVVSVDEPAKVYQDVYGSSTPQYPCPSWFGPLGGLEYDTYVGNGFPCDIVPLTGAVDLGGDPAWTFDDSAISIGWYTTDTDDVGEFWLARITLVDDATGTWSFLVTAAPAEGPLLLASGPVVDGHMVPEPATLVLVGCGAACLAGRTSKQEAAT